MDILDVYIKERPYIEEGYPDKIDQELILTVNGNELPPVYDFGIIFSYKQKLISTDVFTCSCGNSGCAGWFYGVDIKNKKHTTEWRVLDDKEQRERSGVKRFYSFSRENYDAVCLKCIKLALEIEQKKLTLPAYQCDDYHRRDFARALKWLAYHYHDKVGYQLLKKEYEQMKALLVPIGRTPDS